ncbi:DUF4397 domain-containing protein [Mitsuaria sp. WAJ17]|uniref:DUF4397 domain-containing protein n=1 Tax=Mitsuaria sp. WAJ17 TaxID=2761452 RepID=UPI0016026C3C|nr:DUF4397 domain-containing protein [Mitsuaria sp. WAJ17]MBB2483777.1 DUF4397 domain-containing protein [Mitsuaria sp. WAJ17]
MRFTRWASAIAMIGTLALSACGSGGGGNDGNTNVRLLNASVGYSSLDLKVNDTKVSSGVNFGTVSNYGSISTGSNTSELLVAGSSTLLSTPGLSNLIKDGHYTLIAFGNTGSMSTRLLNESETEPASGSTKLLTLNLAADSGTVDVYVTAPGAPLTDATPVASNLIPGNGDAYRTITSGTYQIRVTATGSKTDLRLDIPSVTLDSTKVNTLVLTSAGGGVMVNGLLLAQQGAVTKYTNGLAKVRAITTLPRGVTVTAKLNGFASLDNYGSPSQSPAYSDITVTNGVKVDWIVNGVTQPSKQIALENSAVYAMLIWGDTSAPTLTVLKEDNSLPSTANTAKVRVLNGVPGLTNVALYNNTAPVISNVAPGSLSATTNVSAGTNGTEVQVEIRAGAPTVFSEKKTMSAGKIYTVILSGKLGAIEGNIIEQ